MSEVSGLLDDEKYVMARPKLPEHARAMGLGDWGPATWAPSARGGGTLWWAGFDGDDDRSVTASKYEYYEISQEEYEAAVENRRIHE